MAVVSISTYCFYWSTCNTEIERDADYAFISSYVICFWTVVLEKTLESPLGCKEIQPVHPKGDQSRVFIGRTDVEAETPILWPPDVKSWLVWEDPVAGKVWGQDEKGTTEDKMVGWHHWLSWTWIWANSGRQWRTGKPGMLQSMGSQMVEYNQVTEQQQHSSVV